MSVWRAYAGRVPECRRVGGLNADEWATSADAKAAVDLIAPDNAGEWTTIRGDADWPFTTYVRETPDGTWTASVITRRQDEYARLVDLEQDDTPPGTAGRL